MKSCLQLVAHFMRIKKSILLHTGVLILLQGVLKDRRSPRLSQVDIGVENYV